MKKTDVILMMADGLEECEALNTLDVLRRAGVDVATVSINGKKVQTLSLNSGSFSKVGRKTITVELQAGYNSVRLSNPSSDMPDLDYIDLEPVVPTAIAPALNPSQNSAAKARYDLNGRRVTGGHTQGVLITNGRKVLMQ